MTQRDQTQLDQAQHEQTRAREPDVTGVVERDGVALAYEVFGEGDTTVLLMPTWSIVHSRVWKAQVAYLARHYRVVTFDGRGCGRSGRPEGAAAYTNEQFAEDTIAVMDATDTERAVLVALSCGAAYSVHVAADHPDRVTGIFAIGPSCGFTGAALGPGRGAVGRRLRHPPGLAEVQRGLLAQRRLRRLPRVLLLEDVQRAALDQADRGLRRLGPRDQPADPGRHHRRPDRLQRCRLPAARTGLLAGALPGDGRPRHERRDPPARHRRTARRAHRRVAGPARGCRPRAAGAAAGADQPDDPRLRRPAASAGRAAYLGRCAAPPPPRALPVVPDRSRPRPPRHRDRRGAAQARARPRGRLARPASRHPGPRGRRRAGAPRVRVAGQRVGAHRARGGRARPARVPGDPADGRDPGQQLHGVPGGRRAGALRPGHRRRGLGRRLLPAREPRAQAVRVRVDDRLRRLDPDAGRRGPRGPADGRLQRGDDRAAGPVRAGAGPVGVRRQPRGRRARELRARSADDP